MSIFENSKRLAFTAGLLLLIAAGIGAYWYLRPDPQFVKVMELREQLTSEEARKLPREQRRALWTEFRQEVAKLTPEQRRQLWADRANRFQERLEKFAKASPKERTAMLDEQIKRQEDFRRNAANQGLNRANWGGSATPEDREQRRRQWLDNTTPEQRAVMAEFRQQLQQRRQQLGLPSSPWGGGRG
jgi:predicted transcriptional regulator